MKGANFDLRVVSEAAEATIIKVTSRDERGLPRYSPSFISDLMSALSAHLRIDSPNVLFEALESEGLHELVVRVFQPMRQ